MGVLFCSGGSFCQAGVCKGSVVRRLLPMILSCNVVLERLGVF